MRGNKTRRGYAPITNSDFWKGDTPPKTDVGKGTLFLSGRDTLDIYFHNDPGRRASCFILCLNPLEDLPSISRYGFFSHVRDMTTIGLHPPRRSALAGTQDENQEAPAMGK